jgi:hypothetical protein
VAQAREAMEAGADVIVAQGTEAGGHGQSEPLVTLLPQVVDACPDTPIVAARWHSRWARPCRNDGVRGRRNADGNAVLCVAGG